MKKYISRSLEAPLREAVKHFPVTLVTGPRQAGKSTLLQQVLKGYNYVTLDDLLIRDLAKSDPALFLKTYPAPLIIDKIQYEPSLLPYIKMLVDANRQTYGQYVLTGSQIFPLMQGVSESLAGRIMILQLYPLSWEEIPNRDPTDEMVTVDQMLRGFYPEFQTQKDLQPKFWHNSYLTTYIERDLRDMRKIHDLSLFQRFLVLVAARAGQLLNLSEIGKECGISQSTAKEWLLLLQATSIVYLLEPYARNMTKRVIKSPKVYFIDTGLLCYLLRIETREQLINSPFRGHIFENMVIMEKVKHFAGRGERAPCYFYRTSKGLEVDLLVDYGSDLDAYEIKFTASPNKLMTQPLSQFTKDFPTRHAALLCLRKDKLPFSSGVTSMHWSKG